MLSMLRQETLLLASGIVKPFFTKDFVVTSNSRTTLASAPPRDKEIRQRSYFGIRKSTLCQTQFSFSAFPSASRSRTVSHFGVALRYSSRVVRRQRPRGFFSSRQTL